MKLILKDFGAIISDQTSGDLIYNKIKEILSKNENCIVDFDNVKSMATFNAKQIFGRLYLELGSDVFFQKLQLENVSDDLRLIIRLGIQSAIEDSDR
ncbi:MAG: STAS-like domain-containing protein [Chitinophagaceae bacterium]|jgi:hypothetical protein